MLLESGPAQKDRLYNLIFSVFLLSWAVYCYYDGAYAYINENRVEARKVLTPIMTAEKIPAVMGEGLPNGDLEKKLKLLKPDSPDKVQQIVGFPPIFTKHSDAGEAEVDYYISDYGMLTVPRSRGSVDPTQIRWEKWKRERDDIQLQFGMMGITLLIASLFIYRTIKGTLLRARITETEMVYGRKRIPVNAMTSLTDYSRKGWVDLYYSDAAGARRKLRIDNQKIDKFDEIIDTLCALKGFPDPRGDVNEKAATPPEESV